MFKIMLVFCFSTLFSVSSTIAEEFIVKQVNKAFVPDRIEIKVGDTVIFWNAETKKRRHNIYSITSGFEYIEILGQMPGDRNEILIQSAGSIDVYCALHPRMRLKIIVTE